MTTHSTITVRIITVSLTMLKMRHSITILNADAESSYADNDTEDISTQRNGIQHMDALMLDDC
jgi:hypothetical protein